MLALLHQAIACPPTAERVASATLLFEDAETEDARTRTQQALDELACQSTIVERGTLLELFRLDAQIALADLDKKGATYATIRSVVIDPASVPPPSYGPQLAELHVLWRKRLATSTIALSVSGGGIVYLDGLPIVEGQRLHTVPGEHLVQIDSGTSVVSTVTDLDKNQAVLTGLPSTAPRPTAPSPRVAPQPLIDLDAPAQKKRTARKPSPLLMIAGSAMAVAGGTLLTTAWYLDEVDFGRKTFRDGDQIRRQARTIRALYGTGYGVGGIGAVVFGVGAVGRQVKVEGRWRF